MRLLLWAPYLCVNLRAIELKSVSILATFVHYSVLVSCLLNKLLVNIYSGINLKMSRISTESIIQWFNDGRQSPDYFNQFNSSRELV